MTLEQYRIECGWSQAQLARMSGLDVQTARRALTGEPITANTANKLAKAISEELGKSIRYTQFDGLNVNL